MINVAPISIGSDPEVFFSKDGLIVGAERVIPENGLTSYGRFTTNRVVLDGVQAELHPTVTNSIREHADGIKACFKAISDKLAMMGKTGFEVNFTQVVKVDPDELSKLSEKARVLGCQSSFNIYRHHRIRVKPDFPMRSAAGHLHLGLQGPIYLPSLDIDYRKSLVPIIDILVGNTSVLLDRDPLAAERRKLYGHAGEFRLPSHGLEYRTPSNFWLRSGYGLMELVFGLAHTAVSVLHSSLDQTVYGKIIPASNDYEAILASLVDLPRVERAIEKNNPKLAWKNWQSIKPFWQHVPNVPSFPINCANIDKVDKFLSLAMQDKLTPFLPPDPIAHWLSLDTRATNWTTLLEQVGA